VLVVFTARPSNFPKERRPPNLLVSLSRHFVVTFKCFSDFGIEFESELID
jgi:hypothetical protein